MAVRSKTGVSAQKLKKITKPKLTRQGDGKNSKANHGRKLSRGQGK